MEKKIFDKFRALVFETTGISLSEQKLSLVTSRISKRMRTLQISNYGDYYECVTSDQSGVELRELINAISTNVTHFFRESRHFDYFGNFLREHSANGTNRLRIWCAACSTGEEPYTILMTALENMTPKTDLKLFASDISTKVLQIAKFGVYKESDLDGIPKPLLRKYFRKGVDRAASLYRIKPELRNMVEYSQINLSTPPYPVEGGLDMIFCRNVMIYFNQEMRAMLVQNFERMLKPGGLLFVGLAESLSGVQKTLLPIEPSIYRKP